MKENMSTNNKPAFENAYGAQALKRRSVKIHRSQPACRQDQRLG
jgi:hypothetical protein